MAEIKNVFISHVHEDDDVVQDLKSLLAKNGYDIRDGSIDSSKPNEANNPEYIKSAILAPRINWAGAMIVLISPNTHESQWVNWEIEYAQKQEKRIIGVWIHGGKESDLPENLKLYANAVVGWQVDSVIDALNGKINNWTDSSGDVRPPQTIPRYNC